MNEKEEFCKLIKDLASIDKETEVIEFKVNNYEKNQIGIRISALSNAACLHERKKAYLVFGIKDGVHEIVGTKFRTKNEKVGNEPLEFWLLKHLNPKLDFRIYNEECDGKNIVIFEIPPALNQPVRFNGEAYIRIDSTTPPLRDYPEKEAKIWSNINKNNFEKGIAKEDLSVEDVLRLLDYSAYFTLTKQDVPSDTINFVDRMEQHGLVKKNFENNYDITNLGAVLFAKDMNNFPSIKRKAVRTILYRGNSREEILKEQQETMGYAIIFGSLLKYINDKLPSNEEISGTFRREVKMYPEVAIREFVANALIHQDLSISGAGPLIEIFENRIEITNTGEPLIDVDRFIDHPPRSRNEDLASFMRQIGVCEEGGTGIDRALINIDIYQLPAPLFEKLKGSTRVTLFARKKLKNMTIEDKVRACYQHCVLKYLESLRMTNATLRKRLGIGDKNYPAASSIIRETINKGYIKESKKTKEYIPHWA